MFSNFAKFEIVGQTICELSYYNSNCGYKLMADWRVSDPLVRVRFSLPAPIIDHSIVHQAQF